MGNLWKELPAAFCLLRIARPVLITPSSPALRPTAPGGPPSPVHPLCCRDEAADPPSSGRLDMRRWHGSRPVRELVGVGVLVPGTGRTRLRIRALGPRWFGSATIAPGRRRLLQLSWRGRWRQHRDARPDDWAVARGRWRHQRHGGRSSIRLVFRGRRGVGQWGRSLGWHGLANAWRG